MLAAGKGGKGIVKLLLAESETQVKLAADVTRALLEVPSAITVRELLL